MKQLEELKNQIGEQMYAALRPYQQDALLTIYHYVSSQSTNQALIKMPMGTGKSTLIAITSSNLQSVNSSLVVTATTAVKDQLLKDIAEKVWVKLGVNERPSKEVVDIKPSKFTCVPENHTIFVTTIQSLLLLKGKMTEFELLRNKVDLVIFDEGHKEPADEWQKVIRSFNKKVVLFTATPVRNDQNKFKIDPNYIFSYPFQMAREQGFIRSINFEGLRGDDNNTLDLSSFASKLFIRYEEYLQQEGLDIKDVKVIIRCGNAEDIEAMVNALKDKSSVIGIHEKFNSDDEHLTDQVPDVRSSDVVFWVHQYKLIEGIDNYQFSMLAIYESLPDPRSLIQQIGRVMRESENSRAAVVLLRENGSHQKEWWNSYLEFESLTTLNPAEVLFKYEDYFNNVKGANPSATYLNKKFLKRFSIEFDQGVEGKLKKYQVPRKTNVFEFTREVDDVQSIIEILMQQITEEFADLDVLILDRFKVEDKYSACIVYSRYENSSVLTGESFLEIRLEIVVFRIMGNKLYYYDSNRFIPTFIKKNWRRISANNLKKLFSNQSKFSSMTIQNGSINFNSFNRMIVNSQDVSRMVPDVTDKFNLCTTLVGSGKEEEGSPSQRRYIGFSNTRISQETHAVPLTSYLGWIEEIDDKINDVTHQEHEIFQRFAPITDIPTTVTPTSILFDFNTNDTNLITWYGSSTELDQSYYKIRNSKFSLIWDGDSFEVEISFLFKTGTYKLQFIDPINCPKLYIIDKKRMELLDWLNEEQEFQIIVEGNEHRYYMGNFYKVGVPEDYSWLTKILDENDIVLPRRVRKVNEKGDPKATVDKVMWDANSLFYLIAQRGTTISNASILKTLLSNADYIVCTDLQTEIADFITISESTKTICFIHCKAGDSKLSASAFQEVCGQVVKNLDYVNPSTFRTPYNISNWDNDWTHKNYKVRITRRIYNPENLSSQEIWSKLKTIQNSPESKTYVIAVMGNAFSKTKYSSEKRKGFSRQAPEVIQIDYLLNQTALAVQRAQAEFIVSFNKI